MSGLVQKVLDNEMGDEVLHVYHPPTPHLGTIWRHYNDDFISSDLIGLKFLNN